MEFDFTDEQIRKACEKCGIKVEFNSDKAGFQFGNEHLTVDEFFDGMFVEVEKGKYGIVNRKVGE